MTDLISPDLLAHATPAEKALYEKALKLKLAKRSPLDFALYVSGRTEEYPHIVYLNELVTALIERRLYKDGPSLPGVKGEDGLWRHPLTGEPVRMHLAISMPPRHGKSYLVSEHLPAWFLVNNPDKRVILCSYEADFAASWGRKAREKIERHPELGVELNKASTAAANWDIAGHRGGMNTAGAGGPITGKGMDLGIVDDPIKNAEEANSVDHRNKLESWWHSTFYSRRGEGAAADDTPILLMYTRWHEDDLAGRLTKADPDSWYVVNLPAISFPETNEDGVSIDIEQDGRPDPLGRGPGEALCEARISLAGLRKLQESPLEEGKLWFESLYQGRPALPEGGVFSKSHFRYYRTVGDHYELTTDAGIERVPVSAAKRFITIDLADSKKTSADWTVFSVWDALPGGRLLLAGRFRDRVESADHVGALKRFIAGLPKTPRIMFAGIENKTFGSTMIQNLIRDPIVAVRPLKADTDKHTRALTAGQMVTNHQVFWPADAPWLKEWEHEHTHFGSTRHDDQVDTTAYAAIVFMDLALSVREPHHEPVTHQEKVAEHAKRLEKRNRKRGRSPVLGRW